MYRIFPSYNLEEINGLVVDNETNEASTKAACIPQMPLGQGSLPDLIVIQLEVLEAKNNCDE